MTNSRRVLGIGVMVGLATVAGLVLSGCGLGSSGGPAPYSSQGGVDNVNTGETSFVGGISLQAPCRANIIEPDNRGSGYR